MSNKKTTTEKTKKNANTKCMVGFPDRVKGICTEMHRTSNSSCSCNKQDLKMLSTNQNDVKKMLCDCS